MQTLTDEMWARVEPVLPAASAKGGRPFRDHRTVVEAIVWRYRTGSPWRDLPAEFGAWKTVWRRYNQYCKDGTWDQIRDLVLTAAADVDLIDRAINVGSIDNRAHQHCMNPIRNTGGSVELHESGSAVATPVFKFVDLFAGLGGFHVALDGLGGEGVFAVEWEPTLNALYNTNFGIQPWSDINGLETDDDIEREVPDHNVLTAGFPCQPFSKAGDQMGFAHTAQGGLFFKVHQILKVKRPRRFILENVPNILKHDSGRTERKIVNMLEALGYSVEVAHFSPHQFGIPQVRDRAYFVGSLDGLDGFQWPAEHKDPTDITSVLRHDVASTRLIPEQTLRAIDMWGDFLRRSPDSLKLPSFPIWSMEFGATYPYVEETPPAIWNRRPVWGMRQMGIKGSFGIDLECSMIKQRERIPSHANRAGDYQFPGWKRTFIRQNRDFYQDNRSWIKPWLDRWKPEKMPSSFQKMEWNAQGEERDIDNFVLQARASGLRIKRPTTSPSLIAFSPSQVPILGSNLTGERRYITPAECAELQSLGDIHLPTFDLDAYKALGNAVNARVVTAIAARLLEGLGDFGPHTTTDFEPLGAIA